MNLALSRASLLGLLITAAVSMAHGQGTIVYHNPANIPLFGDSAQYELDLDQNGTVDFRLIKTGGNFTAYGMGDNASLAVPEQPPDLGAMITPLSIGAPIGASLTPPNAWFETEPVPGFPIIVPAFFHACYTFGCIGLFHDVTAYWGVQFEIEGNLHYGWVQVETLGGIRAGGTILDWAYNSVPGQPILAGQVPEPGTWALWLAGAGLLGWRTWRSRQRI